MNNECGNIYTSPIGTTYICDLGREHTGDHKRHTNGGFSVQKVWPNANPTQAKDCRSVYYEVKGGESAGTFRCQLKDGHPGSHIKTFLTKPTITWADKPKEENVGYPWAYFIGGRAAGRVNSSYHYVAQAAEPATYADDEPEETSVLLTLEDLKILAYYLPSDGNDDDAPTVAKIEEALKGML